MAEVKHETGDVAGGAANRPVKVGLVYLALILVLAMVILLSIGGLLTF